MKETWEMSQSTGNQLQFYWVICFHSVGHGSLVLQWSSISVWSTVSVFSAADGNEQPAKRNHYWCTTSICSIFTILPPIKQPYQTRKWEKTLWHDIFYMQHIFWYCLTRLAQFLLATCVSVGRKTKITLLSDGFEKNCIFLSASFLQIN